MSWLSTASNIASLAKTALKEAQKTIDKALDIKENEVNVDSHNNGGIFSNLFTARRTTYSIVYSFVSANATGNFQLDYFVTNTGKQ